MDVISTRTVELATLGLNGLSARHKAIASNIANADTPGYKRIDVTFEDQLNKVIKTEDIKENQRLMNSADTKGMSFNIQPISVNQNQELMNIADFNPQTIESDDNSPNTNENTVNIEQEMSILTKNGMSYNALASLQAREFKGLSEIIRGQV